MYTLGLIFELRGQRDDAVQWYRRCLAAKPKYSIERDVIEAIEILLGRVRATSARS
jgi:hypothetical protein